MLHPLYPCIWYNEQAKEAAAFYCSFFSNSKIISENPVVVIFEINGKKIMALNGGAKYKINPSISFFINCQTQQETDHLWSNLIDGGKILMPLDEYAWSKRYGWVQDKFGMTWQIMLNNEEDTLQQTLTPSLLFTADNFGKAQEAIQFYSSVFENSQTAIMAHYPMEDVHAGKVMFCRFYLNNYPIIAMDGPGVHEYSFNEAVSFVVECDTQEEIDYYWNIFTKDGKESMCGWCKDKFGISWQVVPVILGELMGNPAKRQNVINAFLKMKKIDIQTLLTI
ncbi:MAG TPA: VOC family protein [Chitinophagaceae bacterium]|nr:VOC family protein [Chitinophagaceae bacterium]